MQSKDKNKNNGKKEINVKRNIKGMKRNGRTKGSRQKKILRQTDCNSCVVNLWKYRDAMVKLTNYEKQFRRIKKFKTLGGKKILPIGWV